MSLVFKLLSGPFAVALLAILLLVAPANAEHQSDLSSIRLGTIPERAIVGEEMRFSVSILNKDHRPLTDVPVAIIAEKATQPRGHSEGQHEAPRLSAEARPAGQAGEYIASLKLPSDGEWKITVVHGDSHAEFSLTVDAPARAMTNDHRQDGRTDGGATDKAHGEANSSGPAGLQTTRTIGSYALTLSLGNHPQVGTDSTLALTIVDRQSGAPASGQNVEIIPVHLPESASDGHGEEMETGHSGDNTTPVLAAHERTDAPGRYEARYAFPDSGSHMLLIKTSVAPGELAAMPVTVEGDIEHGAEVGRPSYWFVGTLMAILGITIVIVAVLRQREQGSQPVEVS